MECLRSFIVRIDQVATFTLTDVKTWTLGLQEFWAVDKQTVSQFNIQGFKNIDIYGVDLIGHVQTSTTSALSGCNVTSYAFEIIIDGQLPLVSGDVAAGTNFWNIQTTSTAAKQFALSNFTNSLKFADPISSAKNIQFVAFSAQGVGGQTAASINLDYDLSFVFYYKYEGE